MAAAASALLPSAAGSDVRTVSAASSGPSTLKPTLPPSTFTSTSPFTVPLISLATRTQPPSMAVMILAANARQANLFAGRQPHVPLDRLPRLAGAGRRRRARERVPLRDPAARKLHLHRGVPTSLAVKVEYRRLHADRAIALQSPELGVARRG